MLLLYRAVPDLFMFCYVWADGDALMPALVLAFAFASCHSEFSQPLCSTTRTRFHAAASKCISFNRLLAGTNSTPSAPVREMQLMKLAILVI